jgi:hypothetical protein
VLDLWRSLTVGQVAKLTALGIGLLVVVPVAAVVLLGPGAIVLKRLIH